MTFIDPIFCFSDDLHRCDRLLRRFKHSAAGPGELLHLRSCGHLRHICPPGFWCLFQVSGVWSRFLVFGPGFWCLVQVSGVKPRFLVFSPGFWCFDQVSGHQFFLTQMFSVLIPLVFCYTTWHYFFVSPSFLWIFNTKVEDGFCKIRQ